MEDEEEYADEDESDSESEYDEDDEEEPQPKKSRVLYILICIYWTDCCCVEQAKKKPTPAKKTSAAKKKPAAKPANTRDDWIAKGYDGEAVDTAMEAKPALETKAEIWDAMLERFKFWMVSLLATPVITELRWRCRRRPATLSRHRISDISEDGWMLNVSVREETRDIQC
jgi:hypothetical protein